MDQDSFFSACDKLSRTVDAGHYERLRWSRKEAPMLAHLVELALGAFADREEFELVDESSGHAFRRFVIKVHGTRVFAVVIALSGETVMVDAQAVERSRYRVREGEAIAASFEQIDSDWMAAAFAKHFERVEVRPAAVPQPSEEEVAPREAPVRSQSNDNPTQGIRAVRNPATRS